MTLPAAQAQATSPAEFDAIDAYVRAEVEASALPGLSYAIVRDGEVVHLAAFGAADSTGRPMTADTPVVIGSVGKTLTALAIPSLQSGETADLLLFTQYNPHGLFIAGEALGYLAMSRALLFTALVFAGGRIERGIRWLFVAGFMLAIVAFVAFWLVGGDLVAFEVSVLSINWIVLIASAVLLSIVLRRVAGARSIGP